MRLSLVALAVAATCGSAVAQTSPLIIDQGRADRTPPAPASMGPPVRAPAATMTIRMIDLFVLNEVRLEGTTLNPNLIGEATQPFIGQRIDGPALQRITDAIAAAYERSDIALYTITAPDQNFQGGVLTLRAIEYHLEGVDVTDDRGRDMSLVRGYAAKLNAEQPLRKRTLQRYVSLIRDIPGATPNIQLTPGMQPNANRLSVGLGQKRMQLGLNVNNSGSDLLGRYILQGDVYFYGLLRQGEQTRFTYATEPGFSRFHYFAFSETQPIGSNGTQLQFNAGLLKTKPKGTSIRGEAVTMQLLASHPLIRSYNQNLYVSGSIDGVNSENAVLGQSLANERVRTIRLASSYTRTNARNAFGLAGTLSFGLDSLGARQPNPLLAVSDFFKLNGQAGFSQQLAAPLFGRLRVTGQYSGDRLPTSELVAFGGGDFGRVFPAAAIVGDAGAAGVAELAYRPPGLGATLQGSELYLFADRERTWYKSRLVAEQRFDLSSVGIGTRVAVGTGTLLQLEVANVLDAPAFVADAGDWRFAFGFRSNY